MKLETQWKQDFYWSETFFSFFKIIIKIIFVVALQRYIPQDVIFLFMLICNIM